MSDERTRVVKESIILQELLNELRDEHSKIEDRPNALARRVQMITAGALYKLVEADYKTIRSDLYRLRMQYKEAQHDEFILRYEYWNEGKRVELTMARNQMRTEIERRINWYTDKMEKMIEDK